MGKLQTFKKGVQKGFMAISAVGDDVSQIGPMIKTARDAGKVISIVEETKQAIIRHSPTIKILSSMAVNIAAFNAFLNAAGVVAQFIQVYQGYHIIQELRGIRQEMEAQTGLDAPRKFADQVYLYVHHEIKKTPKNGREHYFFLYHPDTDWHPYFYNMVEREPLSRTFYGMSENLDALCLWMRFLRISLRTRKQENPDAEVGDPIFHLLVPSYRPFRIEEPLHFSDDLHPLCIHGMIHNTVPYVAINLPMAQQDMLLGVAIWRKPKGWLWFVQPNQTPRVLGHTSDEANQAAKEYLEKRYIQKNSKRSSTSTKGK